uniref:Uncharacterized protein n=1 Tax=Arundo donax TaxID=35708 RepID=A0A0A8Z9Q5_ARUDO
MRGTLSTKGQPSQSEPVGNLAAAVADWAKCPMLDLSPLPCVRAKEVAAAVDLQPRSGVLLFIDVLRPLESKRAIV